LLLGIFALHLNGDLLYAVNAQLHGLAEPFNDHLGVHSLLDESLGLFEEFTSSENDRGGSITDLVVLRPGNVYESFSSRVHNVKESNKSGTIIADSDTAAIVN